MNKIKKREDFRPFGGTIMLEYMHDWFNIENKNIKESPYMQYSFEIKSNYVDKIPAISHVNNTCRIQTVTKDQNFHLYNIIDTFSKKTKIPILLNTSFNLAGEPLVETLEDAIQTLNASEINYLYLPEIQTLVTKNKIC